MLTALFGKKSHNTEDRYIRFNGDAFDRSFLSNILRKNSTRIAALAGLTSAFMLAAGGPLTTYLVQIGLGFAMGIGGIFFTDQQRLKEAFPGHNDKAIDKRPFMNNTTPSQQLQAHNFALKSSAFALSAPLLSTAMAALVITNPQFFYDKVPAIPFWATPRTAAFVTTMTYIISEQIAHATRFWKIAKGEYAIADRPPPQKQTNKSRAFAMVPSA